MELYGKTDIGLIRNTNQDAFRFGSFEDGAIWMVVCDGMGGANGGDVASDIAVKSVSCELVSAYCAGMDTAALQGLLAATIGKANASIFAASQENKTLRGMGTTIVAAVVVNGSYYIAYAGDSRAYLVRQGISRQLTTDHSMVPEMVDNGDLTEQEAKFHPHKNIITRVLGVNPDIKVDYREACLESGDILLLCTDGLTNYVDEKIMGSECDGKTLEEYCNALIESAKNGGGGDNITVVAMRF